MSVIYSSRILSAQASRFRKVFHLNNHVISWFYHLILFKDNKGDEYICMHAFVCVNVYVCVCVSKSQSLFQSCLGVPKLWGIPPSGRCRQTRGVNNFSAVQCYHKSIFVKVPLYCFHCSGVWIFRGVVYIKITLKIDERAQHLGTPYRKKKTWRESTALLWTS